MDILRDELDRVKYKIREGLIDPLNGDLLNFLFSGSKMIRSTLPILMSKTLGKNLSDKSYEVLACSEILHNASLLHDDVIDKTNIRRGQTTIGEKFSYNISILSGDYLVSYAIDKLIKINNHEIIQMFNDCLFCMSHAEIQQAQSRGKDVTIEDYIRICEGKTAKLFSVTMKSVALLENLDVNLFETFGKIFGILFQINNDMQDSSIYDDNCNSIKTLRDILGIEKTKILSDNYKRELFDMLSGMSENIYKREIEDIIRGL